MVKTFGGDSNTIKPRFKLSRHRYPSRSVSKEEIY